MTVSAAAITLDRRELADEITFPIFEESIRLLAPRPSEEDRLFAFIRPFDFWVRQTVSYDCSHRSFLLCGHFSCGRYWRPVLL